LNRRAETPGYLTAAQKWAIFLPALAARLAGVAWVRAQGADTGAYVETAQLLLRTGRYPLRSDVTGFRAPGYPFFLIVSTLGHPGAMLWNHFVNAFLGAVGAVILGAIALRLFGNSRVALAVGLAAAFHPAFILLAAGVQSEPLFMVLLLGAGFLLLVAGDRPSSGMALASGGALALAALTRPSALVLAPLLAAPLLDRRFPRRIRGAIAGSALVGFVLVLAPWTVRNAVVHHAFLPVDDAAGFVFLQGNGPNGLSYYRLRDAAGYRAWIADMWAQSRTGFRSIPGATDPRAGRRSEAFRAEALRWIRAHPREEAWLLARKTMDWLRPSPSRLAWGPTTRTLVGAEYVLLYALAAVGMTTAPRRGSSLFCAAVLGVTMAAHVALEVVWRYRMPYWDPILLLYSGEGARRLLPRRTP
jgi:4-amino-4-deoxy-L-arabinose transferase-like glycosyltransferase